MDNERGLSIMHVVLEPRYSGGENLVRDLVQIQAGEGNQTSVVSFRPSQPDFLGELNMLKERGCELHIPARNLERWGRVKWVLAAVKKAKPNIIFAHSFLPSVYARLALRLTRRPAIVTVLHTDGDLQDSVLVRAERFLYSRNACVVGVSPKSVENYRARMGSRVPLRVIQNGIEAELFVRAGRDHGRLRAQVYSPTGGEIIALQVGRIAIQKQQHVSVEALGRLHASGLRNIRLVLAGVCDDAAYREKVLRCARDGGVEDKVQLLGPQKNIAEMLAGADIFLMPSAWEAHSVAALEALASGVFCVFSGIEAFAEMRSFPGIAMIGAPPAAAELGACLEGLVKSNIWEQRFERELGRYSISRCAAEYMRIVEEFGRAGSRVRAGANP